MGENWTLHFDGATEPINPRGISTFGFVLKKGGVTAKVGKGLAATPGNEGSTNNVAEYHGLIRGLEAAKDLVMRGDRIDIFGDSELVIKQLNKEYAVRAPHLAPLCSKAALAIYDLQMNGRKVDLKWIPRERNGEADKLSRDAVEEVVKADPGLMKRLVLAAEERKKSLPEAPKPGQGSLFGDMK
jgi:ribonuclease HI